MKDKQCKHSWLGADVQCRLCGVHYKDAEMQSFEVDLDLHDENINGSLYGKATRRFTLTVSDDSDEQIATRFEHELKEFVYMFCHPNEKTFDELAEGLL